MTPERLRRWIGRFSLRYKWSCTQASSGFPDPQCRTQNAAYRPGAGKLRPRRDSMDYDLKITGGTIIDGTGSPAREGDVAIKDGKIAAVGEAPGKAAAKLEAHGRVVAPGF